MNHRQTTKGYNQNMKDDFCIEGVHYSKNDDAVENGGNGRVVFISSKKSDKTYAVKFFNKKRFAPKRLDKLTKEEKKGIFQERYKRFQKEVKFVTENPMDGIIPIVKSNIPDNPTSKMKLYYIMPKASKIDFNNNSIVENLKIILSLAKTLKKIHNLGYAHRDIKPENILLYKDKPCFCDFGLLWYKEDDERITTNREKVGPYKIIPPELECVDIYSDIDYRYSDVYLLAKVLWIYLKGDKNGFIGEYTRSKETIYLPFYEDGCVPCFEHIHTLLENTTKNSWRERENIDYFIKNVEDQISIMEDKYCGNISKLNYMTDCKKMYYSDSVCSKKYSQIDEIYEYVLKIRRNTKIIIHSEGDSCELSPVEFKRDSKEMIIVCKYNDINIEIHIIPVYLEIDNNCNSYLYIGMYNGGAYTMFNPSHIDINNENIFYLSNESMIELIPI